jgi:hypothetical protein
VNSILGLTGPDSVENFDQSGQGGGEPDTFWRASAAAAPLGRHSWFSAHSSDKAITMSTYFRCGAGLFLACVMGIGSIGCEGTVSLIPDADPALRQPPPVFAADAAKRRFEAEAPLRQSKDFMAQYELNPFLSRQVDLANVSGQNLSNVEVWINHTYVVFCHSFPKQTDKTLYFTMFYDRDGHHYSTEGGKDPIASIDVYYDGVMHSVPHHVAD